MNQLLSVAASELILGTQGSGKTARAESLALAWLAQAHAHRAVYLATAQVWDADLRNRFARHRRDADRAARVSIAEGPLPLAQALGANGRADTLIVADCLTLWLTARLMPAVPGAQTDLAAPLAMPEDARTPANAQSPLAGAATAMANAIAACAGPLVLVGHESEVGLAANRDAKALADSLSHLDRAAAAACERVTLMSGGLPMLLKGRP